MSEYSLPTSPIRLHFNQEAEIAALAYRYYCEEGCPKGKAEEHWLRAERELLGRSESIETGSRSQGRRLPETRIRPSNNRRRLSSPGRTGGTLRAHASRQFYRESRPALGAILSSDGSAMRLHNCSDQAQSQPKTA